MKVKQFFLMLFVALTISFGFTSCATVDSGNEGVGVSWGGETDMDKTYTEGLHWGVRWIFDDMIDYDCRQKTVTLDNEFLDKDGLPIPIKAVLYYKPVNNTVNKLHKDLGPKFEEDKIKPIFSAALKNVVPKYKALELNVEYRDEADAELAKYLEKELQANYCTFIRVNIIDVDIPNDIKNVIIAKQKQDEANLLAEKKERAAARSHANYAFYLGATNDNVEELKRLKPNDACAIKIFMGASTGNMLVNNKETLEGFFKNSPLLIVTHCEDTPMITELENKAREKYGEDVPFDLHPEIRSREACFKSSELAVGLVKKYNSRLHVLHLTTAEEIRETMFGVDSKTSALIVEVDNKAVKLLVSLFFHHYFLATNDRLLMQLHLKHRLVMEVRQDHKFWQSFFQFVSYQLPPFFQRMASRNN